MQSHSFFAIPFCVIKDILPQTLFLCLIEQSVPSELPGLVQEIPQTMNDSATIDESLINQVSLCLNRFGSVSYI